MPRIPVAPGDVWGQALNADLDGIEALATRDTGVRLVAFNSEHPSAILNLRRVGNVVGLSGVVRADAMPGFGGSPGLPEGFRADNRGGAGTISMGLVTDQTPEFGTRPTALIIYGASVTAYADWSDSAEPESQRAVYVGATWFTSDPWPETLPGDAPA